MNKPWHQQNLTVNLVMQQTADGAADLLVLFLHYVNHPLRTSGFTPTPNEFSLSGRRAYRQIGADQGM